MVMKNFMRLGHELAFMLIALPVGHFALFKTILQRVQAEDTSVKKNLSYSYFFPSSL